MSETMKRFLAVLLCALLLVACLAPAASASTKMYTTKATALYKSASASSGKLKTIPSGSTVYRLLSYAVSGFYKVSYKGVVGYVSTSSVSTSNPSSGSGSPSSGGGGSFRPGGFRPGGFRPGSMKPKLTLSQSKLSLFVIDDPVQLTATVTQPTWPGQKPGGDDAGSAGDTGNGETGGAGTDADTYTYTWTSTDPTVATVVDGLVTPVSVGSCKVKCIVQTDSGKLTATCKVTVKAVKPESVTLNATSITLTVGETYQLEAQIAPETATNQSVGWKSNKKKVAQVSSTGLITAKKAGTAKITCTAKGNKKVKVVCKVTVVADQAADTGKAAIGTIQEVAGESTP